MALSETLVDSDEEIDADGIPPGTVFGAFLIQRSLGRGGMGAVYAALETRLDRSVALKVLPAEFLHDPTFARRFETEARLAARLEHPNIVPIYASGIEQGIPWMSMRLLAGKNLSALLRDRRLSIPESVALLKQVAAALDHAHASGVVHRDIKPANILLDRSGIASVADFGLAQLMDSGARLTRTGMLSGTPHYMAPEQALGQRVDHRCDIYALGIVAYEMLVGRTPFGGDSPVAVLLQQVHQPLPAPADQALPAAWMKAIQKATAKDPAERWPSAGAFVDALASSIAVVPAVQDPAERREPGSALRRPAVLAILASGLVIAVLVWVGAGRSPGDRLPAPPEAATAGDEEGPQPPEEVPTTVPTPADSRASGGQPAPVDTPRPGRGGGRGTPQEPPGPGEVPTDKEPPAPEPPSPPSVGISEGPGGLESLPRLPGLVVPAPPQDEFTPAEPVRELKAEYPPAAKTAKMEGQVVLRGVVDVDGNVTNIEVVQSPHEIFKQPAIEAFRRFRYKPARRNGVAVPFQVTVPFVFKLEKN